RAIYLDHTPPPLAALSTLSLHDALPILKIDRLCGLSFGDITDALRLGQQFLFRAPRTVQRFHDALGVVVFKRNEVILTHPRQLRDRKSTRLNSSHVKISYAVFCLKKKKP